MGKKILVIIPARGGSKGLPGKNIKLLNGKPLINYSIDVARDIVDDIDICVSTDDDRIIQVVEDYGLQIPFKRPDYLATDVATTNDVLLHAIEFYESKGIIYDIILLLQPTSPLRQLSDVREAISSYNEKIDMVVSVKESHAAAVICKENEFNFLERIFNKKATRRQEIQNYYEFDGSIYVINVSSIKEKGLSNMDRVMKFIVPKENAIDIDDELDWAIVEFLMKRYK